MSVGFGFSVGDLVAGLKVIKDAVEAVKDTKGASADYAALIAEISSLQDGLEAIDDLRLGYRGLPKQQIAIDRAIGACRKCVDDFATSIAKYQPHLKNQTTGVISSYRKIRWALCKKEDVAVFRSRLERHTSSINMLILSLQAYGQASAGGGQGSSSGILMPFNQIQDHATLDMLRNLSAEQRQCFEILMRQNRDLMRSVQDLQRMLQIQITIPPQVLLQQPVILLDAFGKLAPFHLEFIDCLETFTAVLKIRFRKEGVRQSGLAKVDNREFTIQETRRRRPIDVEKPWSKVFQPGQEVDMSMVFHRLESPASTCPGCRRDHDNSENQIQCQECGLCYQNIEQSFDKYSTVALDSGSLVKRFMNQSLRAKPDPETHPHVATSEGTLFDGYRRVQVIFTSISSIQTDSMFNHPIEAFPNFVALFRTATKGQLPHLADLKQIGLSISDYNNRQGNIPQLSLVETKRWHKQMAEEFVLLQQSVAQLMDRIYADERSTRLLKHIYQNHPRERISPNPYTTLLVESLRKQGLYSEIDTDDTDVEVDGGGGGGGGLSVRTKTPHLLSSGGGRKVKVRSKDQMQWVLLDSRGN